MSASMAEVLAEHGGFEFDAITNPKTVTCFCQKWKVDWERGAGYVDAARRVDAAFWAHQAAALAAAGYGKLEDAKAPEVRYVTLTNGETELDEIVARNASVHLEAMDDNHWWMAIESCGTRYAVNLYTKRAKITAHAEEEQRPSNG